MKLLRRGLRALWSPEPFQDPCVICGRAPTIQLEVRQVRVRGFSDFEWGKWTCRSCRDHGMERALAWARRSVLRGWWNPSAFFPNFLAVGFDGVALVRLFRMPPPKDGPGWGSPLQIARLHGREDLVRSTLEGMGERAWTERATHWDPAIDPELREALMALLETESWGFVRDDWF